MYVKTTFMYCDVHFQPSNKHYFQVIKRLHRIECIQPLEKNHQQLVFDRL